MHVIAHTSCKSHCPIFAAGVLLCLLVSSAQAVITTYTDETAYRIELLSLGYTTVTESFEDDAAWGAVRTTVSGGQMTARSITSQGVTWTHNFPEVSGNNITTGSGPARTGDYGFFALPHGNYLNGPCAVPGHCSDGFIGSTPRGTLMYAVGGWLASNQAKIGVYLDDGPLIGFGGVGLTNAPAFFGVIDTDGFNQFKFQEQEGTKEDAKYVFSDDFTIALAPGTCGENSPPAAYFTMVQTDANVSFTDASSDSDGSVAQWLWDFGDGNYSNEQNASHTYLTNGDYSVILYVRDDGDCSGVSSAQLVSVSSYTAPDVAITSPSNGATLSGILTLTVSINTDSVNEVTYFLDDTELESLDEAPYSASWDTTGTSDGLHTLHVRLVKNDSDKTEIFTNPISVIISNTPIDGWRRLYFATVDLANVSKEATLWGDSADADKDGNSNWKEYVFGGDPLDPSDANLYVSVNISTDSQGDPVLEVTSRKRTNDPALSYAQEVSGDLIKWSSGPTYTTTLSTIPVDVGIEQVTFKGSGLGITKGLYFGRVSVTSP